MLHILCALLIGPIFVISVDVQASPTDNKNNHKKIVERAERNTKSVYEIMHSMYKQPDIVEPDFLQEEADRTRCLSIDTTITNNSLSEELNDTDISVQRSTAESRRMFNSLFVLEQAVVCTSTLTKDQLMAGYLEQQNIAQAMKCLSLRARKYAQASLQSLKNSIDEFDKN